MSRLGWTAALGVGWLGMAGPLAANSQQLVSVLRQIPSSSSSPAVWSAYVQVTEIGHEPYLSLTQVSELINGQLRWRSASRGVDLRVRGQSFLFQYDSPWVRINGRRSKLDFPTVKNEDGFWVPARFFATPRFYQLTGTRLGWPENRPAAKPVAAPAAAPMVKPNPIAAPEPHVSAIRRIVIDPGHGGKDPGAVGPRGTLEKDITLQLGLELAEELRAKGYEVLLTRMEDAFVPLADRPSLANRHEADLFVSLHCNASVSSKLKGFEVYFLSEKASDARADAVARFENAPLALEGRSAELSRLEKLLQSMVKNANINESSVVGALMHDRLGHRLSTDALGVKQAAFYVLRGAQMPAVLVEVGFLSNPQEEKRLKKSGWRDKIIDSLSEAIAAYDLRLQKQRR